MKVLVVGATGQLGTRIIQTLIKTRPDVTVRGMVRPRSHYAHLRDEIEIVFGDLRDYESLLQACEGIDVVCATATVVFPKGLSSFEQDEKEGYRNLIKACEIAGVSQFFFYSVAVPFLETYVNLSKTYAMKNWCEIALWQSTLNYTILKLPPFMDDYFALMGSEIPLVGEPWATLNRASGLTAWFRRWIRKSVEKHGLAWVPGKSKNRHAFISVEQVAQTTVSLIGETPAYRKSLGITGPEDLSWQDVCDIYAGILNRPVRAISLPSFVLKGVARLTFRFSESLSNQIAILFILSETETRVEPPNSKLSMITEQFTAKRYLESKFSVLMNQKEQMV